ncbi:Spy/CpxP family protein refolding chaperone [Caballeronia sp. LZ065]|uniref:Spy/CpxP family protein refolding chaperone n=1 Tax=Caballeronia sp. LZ065 TaxID=3038571 RepID=UPI0028547984|nr:Spy/CpxP family protein refolding chaperone [Caballeronia sp. LZ065]MDR5779533.1 Spy/CpxP family protein refolding chaperone [Caballeronia sp. LZ065]
MKRTLVTLAASLVSLGALSPAFAQSSAPAAASASAAQAAASAPAASKREARTEERISELHASLKITPQQEEQWSKFADVMRDNGRTMADLYRQRVAQRSTMSALDDMKQYQQITQANADGTKRLVDAFEPLYASLSPEQKKLADTSFRDEHGKDHRHRAHRRPPAAGAAPASATKP